MTERTILVGIDPGLDNLGICIYIPDTKKMILKTTDILSFPSYLQSKVKLSKIVVVMENPDLDSTTFGMWGMVKTEMEAMINNFVKQLIFSKALKSLPFYTLKMLGLSTKKSATFGQKYIKNKMGQSVDINDVLSKFSIAMNYSQKVGKNKAAAQLILRMLDKANVPVLQIAPSKREKAYKNINGKEFRLNVRTLKMPTKTNAKQFKELTDSDDTGSEHARDAATLVWGRTIKWALSQIQKDKTPNSYPSSLNGNYSIVQRKKPA